jgi:hypothetical protein
MNLDLTNPLIVFAIIVALGTMVAALIKAMAPFKANANQHNVITLLEAQKGRNRVKIEQLKGTDSAFKMEARIQNANSFQIDVFSDSGTVFDTSDKKLQRMVAVRPQVFEVSPASSEDFTIDALCMDAFKAPPPSTGEGAYKVQGVTGDKKIMSLIQALRNIEEDISEKIVSFEVGKGFTVKPMDADIEELLRNCELFPNKDGTYTLDSWTLGILSHN